VNEHHITVRRTARYYMLGPAGAAEVWVVCHGYAQLARYFLRAFQPLDDGTRLIVAPEALNRYYFETAPGVHGSDARVAATWMTREAREQEIDDYISYLDTLAGHVTATRGGRIIAFGFSQGAATVSRWAALGRTRIAHVVLWGSGVAHDLPLEPRVFRGAALTIALGAADPHIDESKIRREQRRLEDAGVPHDLMRYDGGHSIDASSLERLASRLRG
jgi:predicted esterase